MMKYITLRENELETHNIRKYINCTIPNTVVVHLLYTASEITSIYTEIFVQYHGETTDTVHSG